MTNSKIVDAAVYDREYFLYFRGGSAEFRSSGGTALCDAHRFAISLARIRPGSDVLDLGCGCGEVALNVAHITRSVLGIDYSADAISLALESKKLFPLSIQEKVRFRHESIEICKLEDNFYDTIFFLDVIEHLNILQIQKTLEIIYRSLKKGGRVVIHTWPNRWHRQFAYPLSFLIGNFTGARRPKDPRTHHERVMHVAEQSPFELKQNLQKVGFKTKVFVKNIESSGDSAAERIHHLVHTLPLLEWLFCDHVWAVCTK